MPSREKRLTIPGALALVLLAPGALSCSSTPEVHTDCNCIFIGLADGGAVPDGGVVPDAGLGDEIACSGPNDPLFKDPWWSCFYGSV